MTTDELVVDVSQDWISASHVQQRFMRGPDGISGSMDYSAQCRQIRSLGGDCYDFTPLPDNKVALCVGDACGKGLAAALMIANVQSSLKTAALFTGAELATLIEIVNCQTYSSTPEDRYATLFYGVLDRANRRLRYVNAGHNPPLVIHRNRSIAQLETGGPPVGMFPGARYEESSVQLEAGDLLIAYTDGIIEATNLLGEEWGVEGLLEAAVQGWQDSPDAADLINVIFSALDEFSTNRQTDDATLAVVRVI